MSFPRAALFSALMALALTLPTTGCKDEVAPAGSANKAATAKPKPPAVAGETLRAAPTEAECQAFCRKLLADDTGRIIAATDQEARVDIGQLVEDIAARELPACTARCQRELSRASVECVERAADFDAALKCLDAISGLTDGAPNAER